MLSIAASILVGLVVVVRDAVYFWHKSGNDVQVGVIGKA